MITIYIVLLPTLVKYIHSKQKIETNLLPLNSIITFVSSVCENKIQICTIPFNELKNNNKNSESSKSQRT